MHSGGVDKTDTAHAAPNDTFKFRPLFGSGEIKLQTTAKAVTPFAGMASFFAWLGALEFPKQAAMVMPFEYRWPNAIAPEQTLLAFISAVVVGAEMAFVLHPWLRPGNTGAGRDVVEFLKEALKLLPAGMGIRCVRADSGFFDQKLLGFLEDRGLTYIVVARLGAPLKGLL